MTSAAQERDTSRPAPDAVQPPANRKILLDLFLVGVVTLFVELALIRWLATEIRVFAYFKNLTLIGCFFGGALGCIVASHLRWPRGRFHVLLLALVVLVVGPGLAAVDTVGAMNRFLASLNDMPLWNWTLETTDALATVAALAFLVAVFLTMTAIFVPPGQLLGIRLAQAPNRLHGYSANIAGSLAGVVLFDLVSYASLPPVVWFATGCLLAAGLLENRREAALAAGSTAALIAILLAASQGTATTVWSPYQKLTLLPVREPAAGGEPLLIGYTLQVNNTGFQRVANLGREFLAAHRDLFPEADSVAWMGYDLAYRFKERPDSVLVVGAGTGNDVAAALRNGARSVDAVEIDPRIVALGRQYHPERPYADPRVTVVVDDARSYLKRSRKSYDLIVFGALDSHTLNSALSNLRLDNYVYTLEAFAEARERLKSDGLVWLLFAIERPHIAERLQGMLERSFGRRPLVINNPDVARFSPAGGGTTFVIDREPGAIARSLAASPRLARLVRERVVVGPSASLLPSDDWPYLYVPARAVPRLYTIVMGLIVLVALLLVRPIVGHLRELDPHFFALGAGFLLLEVQGISRLALLWGNTWIVNGVVVSAILLMILVANLVAIGASRRWLAPAYLGLGIGLLANFAIPTSAFLSLTGLLRVLLVGTAVGLPLFFAGLIFAITFRPVSKPNMALGSNLLGAIVGGACESLSFVVGLKALALVALVFYAASAVTLLASGRRAGS
jgi:SAM-dependent methyltransferase